MALVDLAVEVPSAAEAGVAVGGVGVARGRGGKVLAGGGGGVCLVGVWVVLGFGICIVARCKLPFSEVLAPKRALDLSESMTE